MSDEIERSLTISNLVDLNGNALLAGEDMYIDQESMIPEHPFEDMDPNEKRFERYTGYVRHAIS